MKIKTKKHIKNNVFDINHEIKCPKTQYVQKKNKTTFFSNLMLYAVHFCSKEDINTQQGRLSLVRDIKKTKWNA